MADLNSDDADGVASKALTMFAPLLWPARVILEALPPKAGTTFCKNFMALTTSLTAKLVAPLGAIKPSWVVELVLIPKEIVFTHSA